MYLLLIPPGSCTVLLRYQRGPHPSSHQGLPLLPNLDQNRWVARLAHKLIQACGSDSKRVAGERRLIISLAQKVRKNKGGKKRVLERNGTKEDADKNNKFDVSNGTHGGVVVCFKNNKLSQNNTNGSDQANLLPIPATFWLMDGAGEVRLRSTEVHEGGFEASNSFG